MQKYLKILLVSLALLGTPTFVFAQPGGFVKLQPGDARDTISSNGDSVILTRAQSGVFGSVKVQTVDTYSGTWEVQCSLDKDSAFDTDNELKLVALDGTTTVYSVTDEVGIWEVTNAAACYAVKVVATAGFAASDTVVVIAATQSGGSSGGGGAGGGGDATNAEQLTQTTHLAAIEAAVEGTLVVGDGAGALNVICDSGCAGGTQYAEDAVHASGNTGTLALVVRNDAGTALAADGDNIPLMVNSAGALYIAPTGTFTVSASNLDVQIGGSDTVAVSNAGLTELAAAINSNLVDVNIVSGAGSGGTALADDADFTAATTSFTPVGGFYQSGVTACTDGDTCALGITAQRTMKVTLFSAAGAELTPSADKAEDAAHSSGDTGPVVLAIRDDTLDVRSSTENDYEPLHTNASGALWVAGNGSFTVTDGSGALNVIVDSGAVAPTSAAAWGIVNEDVASAGADPLNIVGAIRDDTLDARSATEGDYEPLHMNANGALWAIDVNSAAALTSTQLLDDAVFTDDAAFTPATSKGFAIGGQADDTSTDSVDEGDFGAFRISLDRLLYTRTADPCSGGATKLFLPFDITTATTTEITPSLAGASTHYYICALNIVTTAANNVNLVDDNSDNCASVTASLISTGLAAGDGWGFGANGGLTLGNGGASVMRTQTSNSVLCLVTSAATELHGTFVVVAAP